jgi:hypothetical protein
MRSTLSSPSPRQNVDVLSTLVLSALYARGAAWWRMDTTKESREEEGEQWRRKFTVLFLSNPE